MGKLSKEIDDDAQNSCLMPAKTDTVVTVFSKSGSMY